MVTKLKKESFISHLNKNNNDLFALDAYIIPLKKADQTVISAKITLATQDMVSNAIKNGIILPNHKIEFSQISRSKILGTPQCNRCYKFDHITNDCSSPIICLHCTGEHTYKNCDRKSNSPKCANCNGAHKPISNKCPIRKQHLIIPMSTQDPEIKFVRNPESSYTDANIPTTNPWFTKKSQSEPQKSSNMTILQHKTKPVPRPAPFSVVNQPSSPSAPQAVSSPDPTSTSKISYSECFEMALKFNNVFKAFNELQAAFGLAVVNIPQSLQDDLKPEFAGSFPAIYKDITFNKTPSPDNTIAEEIIPSPSTSFAYESINITPVEPPPPISSDEENKFFMVKNQRSKSKGRRGKR